MARKKSISIGTIAGGIIIGIIVAIAATQISDISSKPNIIGMVKSGTTSLCPINLDFSKDSSSFELTFVNHGDDDGSFAVTVMSSDVLSRYQGSGDEFSHTSIHSWYAEMGEEVDFIFELQKIENENLLDPITISANAECITDVADTLNIGCGNKQITCTYTLDEQLSKPTRYNLVT